MPMTSRYAPTDHAKTVTAVTLAVMALHVLVGVGLMQLTAPLKPVTVTPPLEIEFVQPPKAVTPATDSTQQAKPIEPQKPVEPFKPDAPPSPTQPAQAMETVDNKPIFNKAVSPTDSEPLAETHNPPMTTPQPPIVESAPTKPTEHDPAPTDKTSTETTVAKAVETTTDHSRLPVAKDTPVTHADSSTTDKGSKNETVEPFAHLVQPKTKAVETVLSKPTAQVDEASPSPQYGLGNTQTEQLPQQQTKAEPKKQTRQAAEANSETDYSGKMHWKHEPNIQLPLNLSAIAKRKHITDITVRVGFLVSGKVTKVDILQSSGDSQIDTYLQRQIMKGTLYPYAPDGVAVAGIFILPIGITYPK